MAKFKRKECAETIPGNKVRTLEQVKCQLEKKMNRNVEIVENHWNKSEICPFSNTSDLKRI